MPSYKNAKPNCLISASLRRETIRLSSDFLLNKCRGRGLHFQDTQGEEGWMSGKVSGCTGGLRFCLSSTVRFLSDCRTLTSHSFLPFLASKIT